MKVFTAYREFYDFAKINYPDAYDGAKGWTKGKCLDEGCDTTTYWNSKVTGEKCAAGKCGKCGGQVKRTVSGSTSNYIIKD